jgi:hypothetical protein
VLLRLILLFSLLFQAPAATCREAADCRAEAQAAAARRDYEAFHDFAWRAVQKGKPNDPDLMHLLARAQALSGRPGDAIVMLGRLMDLGVTPDAATHEDFAIVRLLPSWPELEARLAGKPAPAAPPAAPPAPPAPAPLDATAPPAAAGSLTFDAPGIEPHGLALDTVSRRFVLGDRTTGRLLVIDQVSRRVVNYVSAASAGFYDDIAAFTIDERRGDLWVASVKGETAASSSVLHKLQLVSGRGLVEARAPGAAGPVRFVDVSVAPDGVVYALDSLDSRIFRLRPGSRTLELAMRLEARGLTALAAADERTVYVAAESGLVRIDLGARSAAPVKSVEELTNFQSLSWRAGSLIGVQRVAASSLIVRIGLDSSGVRAQPRHVLAASAAATVGALGGDAYYYLADDRTIRRLALK